MLENSNFSQFFPENRSFFLTKNGRKIELWPIVHWWKLKQFHMSNLTWLMGGKMGLGQAWLKAKKYLHQLLLLLATLAKWCTLLLDLHRRRADLARLLHHLRRGEAWRLWKKSTRVNGPIKSSLCGIQILLTFSWFLASRKALYF